MRAIRLAFTSLCLLAFSGLTFAGEWQIVTDPQNSFRLFVVRDNAVVATASIQAWGPNWNWVPVASSIHAKGGVLAISANVPLGGNPVQVSLQGTMKDANTLSLEYTFRSRTETPLTLLAFQIDAPSDGTLGTDLGGLLGASRVTLPTHPGAYGSRTSVSLFPGEGSQPFSVRTAESVPFTTDGGVRAVLAQGSLGLGTSTASIELAFPEPAKFVASASDLATLSPVVPQSDWFPFRATWDSRPSPLGMEGWLDAPAGRHGGVRMVGHHFAFEDGQPVKFWGVNVSFGSVAPERLDAEATAARYAKYGINAVRLHKFTGSGWAGIGDPFTASRMDPKALDRFDYFTSQLAKRGIYYGWSHSFQFQVRPGDKARISGYDELAKVGGNTYSVINWADDVQDLLIDAVVGLLKHKNPYSGKTYAEDPVLSFLEVQNEDDIFFFTTPNALAQFPTYRDQLYQRFSKWLTALYGSQEGLVRAWGSSLQAAETLEAHSVKIDGNPWYPSSDGLLRQNPPMQRRILDTAQFLHETQNAFYEKFAKAVRAAGYRGPLVGSPWQAPPMVPHYYNLRSDWLTGYIDRHDYFGGGFQDTMLGTPGGGYLSAGLQQVADRPFSLSEWITVYPSLYSAEGPLLVAAYGLGLQGWGASYEFQATTKRPGELVGELPYGIWNAETPDQMGQFPVLSRMVLRGDVQEGPVVATRRVSLDNLQSGKFDFTDTVTQNGDLKTFGGTVGSQVLAMGRSVVEFVSKTSPSSPANEAPFRKGSAIVSATGQLSWDPTARMVRVDTPGTQGFVGFGAGTRISCADVAIQTPNPYALILVTAQSPNGSLAKDSKALVVLLARNANTGFRIFTVDQKTVVDNGRPPILVEPVQAQLHFKNRTVQEVRVLDNDGIPTAATIPIADDGTIALDTGRDRTLYYLVSFSGP